MKLSINKSYSLFTTSDYISNKKIKVLGFIGYDRASQYKTFVENVAINEKFIDTVEDTETYLKSLIYYDCGVIEYNNGEWLLTGEHIIVWDDIIDTDRTIRLEDQYVYKLAFTFKNLDSLDVITKDDVIALIQNTINANYNTKQQKIAVELTAINANALDSVETQLEKTNEILKDATETIKTFISLQDSAKELTSDIIDNNLLGKVNTVKNNVDTILQNTESILRNTK